MIIWRSIRGFKGLYEISSIGEIRSFKRSGAKGALLKPGNRRGYKSVTLCKGNTRKPSNVHRLVAQTFLKKIKGCPVVNHKDGNKLNNNVLNLEWVTNKRNTEHSINELGKNGKGQKNGNSKLTQREVDFLKWIKTKYPNLTGASVAKFYNVTDVCILDIWSGKRWKT